SPPMNTPTAQAISESVTNQALGWLISVARNAANRAVSSGLGDDGVASYVENALDASSDGALDNAAIGGARGGVQIGRLSAYQNLDPEIKYYVRVEMDD